MIDISEVKKFNRMSKASQKLRIEDRRGCTEQMRRNLASDVMTGYGITPSNRKGGLWCMNSQKAMIVAGIIMILLSALVCCIWVFMPQYRLALTVVFAIPGYVLTGSITYAWLKQPTNYRVARSVYQDRQKGK